MCVDLDRGAVGVGAGWPNGNVAQQTQTVTSTTSSLVQPRTGCVLHTQHTHTHALIKYPIFQISGHGVLSYIILYGNTYRVLIQVPLHSNQ